MNRRRFVQTAAQAALLSAWPGLQSATAQDLVKLSIFHTTDLHGHILPTLDYNNNPDLGGLARCATQIRKWRTENPQSLLLDIGDVYQGTEVSLHSRGKVMTDCLNILGYDAWVVGNHEFDWGAEAFAGRVNDSTMPVLSCNVVSDLSKIHPYLIKRIAGYTLAIVGVTTPGLPYWLPPEFLRDFTVLESMQSLRQTLREVMQHQPDAIILAGHMGLRERDDFANQVDSLTREFPQIVVFLGGHTHKNYSSLLVNNVLYTQADHFGIYAGRVDLTFDSSTRRLVSRAALTVPMDHTVACDPVILSRAKDELSAAEQVMATPVGELETPFSIFRSVTQPSEVERLIGSAMMAGLREKGVVVDFVVHGLFETKHPFTAGLKTIADIWDILPYENQIVTVELNRSDLLALVQDFSAGWGKDARAVMGLQLRGEAQGKGFLVRDILGPEGTPLPQKNRYRVAMNSYDSQSGGQRFFTVARLAASPENLRHLHPMMTRDALIQFFIQRKKINLNSLLV